MTNRKPLFHPRLLKERLPQYQPPADWQARHQEIKAWAKLSRDGTLAEQKEVSLHGEFLQKIFAGVLGYRSFTQANGGAWELDAERTMGGKGKSADGALGFFWSKHNYKVLAPIELKGAKQSLDHAKGRALTPVQQGWEYAQYNRGCRWVLVSNYQETRLYSTAYTPDEYEVFTLEQLEDESEFKRFLFFLSRERLLPSNPDERSVLDDLLLDSARVEKEITDDFYKEYRHLRTQLFQFLMRAHSNQRPLELLRYTQTILDRVLFIAFAEDRGLLPRETIKRAYEHKDPYHPRPVWQNFRAVFRSVDTGNPAIQIHAYNGGLFAEDKEIEELQLTDDICAQFKNIARYDFREDVSVEVLGHIFEQSISDLEELRATAIGQPQELSKRKSEGVFYTPSYITRFIVEETLGKTLAAWEVEAFAASPPEKKRTAATQEEANLKAEERAWTQYRERLLGLRILDLSCGSGAFLLAAFARLFREHERVNAKLAALRKGQATLFDPTKTILQRNLFGVDLNHESVEITRLSLWLKTASIGQRLTSLDRSIKAGNSVVDDVMFDPRAFDWKRARQVIDDEAVSKEEQELDSLWLDGFDIVVGNPPYVRQELLGRDKEHFQKQYSVYHGMADLFVYFFERGVMLLKEGGRLGYVVSNKWLRGGYAEGLRHFFATKTQIETLVDFGHAPIFPDADAFPSVITVRKPLLSSAPSSSGKAGIQDSSATPPLPSSSGRASEPGDPSGSSQMDSAVSSQTPRTGMTVVEHQVMVTQFPREELTETNVTEYIEHHRFAVPQSRFGREPWSLEPPTLDALLQKIKQQGTPLKDYTKTKPYRGILTGLNEAFMVDNATKEALVKEDPKSAEILKKYLRGQDIDRWSSSWVGQWIIFARRGIDIEQYPAIKKHLLKFKAQLEPKPDDWGGAKVWPGRKAGKYKWYEIQDSVEYWKMFEQPKIIYQVIQTHPQYSLDTSSVLLNDKGFFIPSSDLWLLAVLNSPLMWWHNWRYLVHMKNEVLTPVGEKMEMLPIAAPTDVQRVEVERIVPELVRLARDQEEARVAFLDVLRVQYGVETPGQKLGAFSAMATDDFLKEVIKRRAKGSGLLKPVQQKELKTLFEEEAGDARKRAGEILVYERRLSVLVNEAYHLTPEEIALLWKTAPPRMPNAAPVK